MRNVVMRMSRSTNGKRVVMVQVAMRSVTYGAAKLHLSRTVPATSSTPVICTHRMVGFSVVPLNEQHGCLHVEKRVFNV